MSINNSENISDIPENHTIVSKYPTAANILNGDAAADGADTTGGTDRMDERRPEDVEEMKKAIPTDFLKGIKSAWIYTAVTIIGIVVVIWLYRRK